MSELPTTSFAVLGLLSFSSMSGYDLAGLVENSIAHFWPIAKSQVYGELARLEELGYVSSSDVKQERLPDKRMYALTTEGTAVLDGWLGDPGFAQDRFRVSFLVKYFFAQRMPKRVLIEMLENYAARSQKALEEIRPYVDNGIDNTESFFPSSAGLFGVRHLEANVRWTEEVLERIRSMPEEQGEGK
ncbi:MAG: PadR family transcriptional regulator [Actinomycetota bacterium]|nr:PadR family transcriptional regulator [Actinomycetota bacterium]